MVRECFNRWVCCLIALSSVLATTAARGASILVSRQSDIRATGASAAGEYRLSNGAGDNALFSDALHSDDSAVAHSSARQYSQPLVGAGGVFAGAKADGSVRAAVWPGVADAFSDAETDFALVLRVERTPTLITLACTLGASGDGSAAISLTDRSNPEASPVLAAEVANDTRTLGETKLVPPGTYDLSAWGFARGIAEESSAYFTLDLTVQDSQPTVVPMPLPASSSSRGVALAVLAMALYTGLRRRRAVA